jgi:hypothetical protein
MGQQQLLLIVLGVIIVGVAVIIGIRLFSANAKEAMVDNLVNQNMNYIYMARAYYLKPITSGGGGRSFMGWQNPVSGDHTNVPEPLPIGSHSVIWGYNTGEFHFSFQISVNPDGSEGFSIMSYSNEYQESYVPDGFDVITLISMSTASTGSEVTNTVRRYIE